MVWRGWSNGNDRWIRNRAGEWQRVECVHIPEERCQKCRLLHPPGCYLCQARTCECDEEFL